MYTTKTTACLNAPLDENVSFPLITVISSRIILFSLETVMVSGLIT
jgi:hypothetical protein